MSAYCSANHDEVDALYHDLLINVTSFFRNPEAFETLSTLSIRPFCRREPPRQGPFASGFRDVRPAKRRTRTRFLIVEYLGEERADIPDPDLRHRPERERNPARQGRVYKENIEADVAPLRLRRFFIGPMADTRSRRISGTSAFFPHKTSSTIRPSPAWIS